MVELLLRTVRVRTAEAVRASGRAQLANIAGATLKRPFESFPDGIPEVRSRLYEIQCVVRSQKRRKETQASMRN